MFLYPALAQRQLSAQNEDSPENFYHSSGAAGNFESSAALGTHQAPVYTSTPQPHGQVHHNQNHDYSQRVSSLRPSYPQATGAPPDQVVWTPQASPMITRSDPQLMRNHFPQVNDTKAQTTTILADLLIPGVGEPIRNGALVVQDGKIIHVGPQSLLPKLYASTVQQHVPVLMPGMWDCHAHFGGVNDVTFQNMALDNPVTMGARIARSFYDTLMAGFTSVREVGGVAIEAAAAVEEGLILGPNVYGAGAAIGQTNGSCDGYELPVDVMYSRQGVSDKHMPNLGSCTLALADGVTECRRAVRLQVRRGAKCIKIVASGGVMSARDDPKYRQFCDEELKALMEEASMCGRSVAAHAHGKAGVMAAIKFGAKTIEHGTYIDEEAAQAMKDNGVMLCSTRLVVEEGLRNLDKLIPPTRKKMLEVDAHHARAYQICVKKGVKIALGTDICSSDPTNMLAHGRNGGEVVYAVTIAGMTPLQAIEAATANGPLTLGEQAPLSGQLVQGYDADFIALDQNPLENIQVFNSPDSVTHVWKAGRLVKAPGKRFGPILFGNMYH